MAKNSNYFPHDSQMRNSDSLQRLLMKLGSRGYGVFMMLLERLRDCDNYEDRAGYDVVAFTLHEDEEMVRSVVEDFGLFEMTEGGYVSPWLTSRMGKMDDIARKRSEAVSRRSDRLRQPPEVENVLQNPTNVLQNSTNVLQTSTTSAICSGNNKLKNKNKISSSVDDDGRAGAPSPPTPPEKEIIFSLADAAGKWEEDAVWIASVSRQVEMPPAAVTEMLRSFVDRCRAEGKIHADEPDARSHFVRWLKTSDGRKELKRLAARVVAPPKHAAAPRAPYVPPPPGAKPDDIIRRWGYDPAKVTMAQACNPNWRRDNPPGQSNTAES